MSKHIIKWTAAVLVFVMIIVIAVPSLRSMAIMWLYSEYNEEQSLLEEKDIELAIPSGENWYPFVMTFCDNQGFSSWMNEELKLTILYNFPKFSWKQRASVIYDPESEYYSSFYGAYLVERTNGLPYGFDEKGQCILEEVAEVPKFDFWKLVLEDIGMPRDARCFEWTVNNVQENVEYAGESGWTRISAKVNVNGMYHEPEEYAMSYLQYGKPHIQRAIEEYQPIEMQGLIYGKYYPEINVSVFFYCIAANQEVMKEVDETLLSQSLLKNS